MASAAVDLRAGTDTPLAAFVADEATQSLVEQVVGLHWPGAIVATGGLDAASTFLGSASPPDILVIDLGASETPLDDLMQLADSCAPSTEVVALGTVNDLGLYKQFISAGVADYLVKPFSADELEEALLAASLSDEQDNDADKEPDGRMVIVIGARGGVGASTVAVNGAWLMAEEFDRKTALVDLDIQFGTSALALDLVPSGGLLETLRNPGRLDSLFMASALLPKTENLSILAAEEDLSRDTSFRPEGVERLIEEVRRDFEWVWIDMPRSLGHVYASLLPKAAHILIVSDLTLAGMRDTMRLCAICEELVDDGKVGIIVNQTGRVTGLTAAQFAKGIPLPVVATLEDERKSGAAAVSGKPLVEEARRGKFATAMRKIVEPMVPSEEEEKVSSGGLFGISRKGKRK